MTGNKRGAAAVETVLLMAIFFTALYFSSVQLFLLSLGVLSANESVYTSVRAGVVKDSLTEATREARICGFWTLLSQAKKIRVIPSKIVIYEKTPLNSAGRDASGGKVVTMHAGLHYFQRIMFGSFLQPKSLGVPLYHGVVRCAMVKSPDAKYLYSAWPDAKRW